MVRTSIDLDEDVYLAAKELRLPLSSLFNAALLDYLGAASVDEDIARIRGIRESVAKVCEISRLKTENREKREAIAVSAVKNRIGATIEAELAEADARIADEESRATHHESLERSWAVMVKKKKIFPTGLLRKLPENDVNMDFTDYWTELARDISKVAGDQFTDQEVIAYARQQVAVL